MNIEGLRKAVTDKRFILSANPDWREGRACGLTDDKTEQKANDALTIILENIAELVVAYLIDDRQSVKSEDVQRAIGDLLDMKEHWCADSTDNDAISIDLAIAALQAYQPWVSVDDRLPELDDALCLMVFTWSEKNKELEVQHWRHVQYDPDTTHWCPLPEPPKGE